TGFNGNNVFIGYGKGNGFFAGNTLLSTGGEHYFWNNVIVADFNNDGQSDIATVNADGFPQTLAVLLRSGASFVLQPILTLNSSTISSDVNLVAADFDHDGKMDIASVASSFFGVRVARGNGDGTFSPPVTFTTSGNSPLVQSLATGDLDNDGRLDLVLDN